MYIPRYINFVLFLGDRNYYTLKTDDIIMMREEWRKLEKESYLKVGSNKPNTSKKTSDMIKKRPEGEESTADEADVSDTEKVILQFTDLDYKLIDPELRSFLISRFFLPK